MAADGKVRIQIDTNAGKATTELKNFDKAVKDVQKDGKDTVNSNNMLQDSMNKLKDTAKKLVGAYLGLQGIRAVTNYVNQSVEAFRTQERAILSLETALQNAGVYTQEYSNHLQQLASTIQSYSNYGDEAVERAVGLGQAFAGQARLTDDLIRVTVDFAAAMDMDLDSAFRLVGKSIGSSTNALSRYGIELKEGMTDSQKLTAIAEQLGQRYEGQARNMANASVQLKNAIGDLSEAIGQTLNPAIESAQNSLTKLAQKTTWAINTIRVARKDINDLTLAEAELRLEQANSGAAFTRNWGINKKYVKSIEDRIAALKKLEAVKTQQSQANAFKMTDDIAMPSLSSTTKTSNLTAHTQQVQQAKTAYEQLQIAVTNAKNAVLNAAVTYGTSSEQVQNAMLGYKQVNEQLTQVQKVFDLQVDESGKTLKETSKNYDGISRSLASTITGALASGGDAFKSFANLAVNSLERVIAKVLEMAVITPILNSFTGGFGGTLLSFLPFSKGGAFENGVQKFASGGVVNQPTTFPMASGKTGLMGEAGAEAIMPLKRTASGDLGIQATQPNINIYNQSGSQIETVTRPNGDVDLFIKRVNNALSNERTQQGFSSALQRNNSRGLQAS